MGQLCELKTTHFAKYYSSSTSPFSHTCIISVFSYLPHLKFINSYYNWNCETGSILINGVWQLSFLWGTEMLIRFWIWQMGTSIELNMLMLCLQHSVVGKSYTTTSGLTGAAHTSSTPSHASRVTTNNRWRWHFLSNHLYCHWIPSIQCFNNHSAMLIKVIFDSSIYYYIYELI